MKYELTIILKDKGELKNIKELIVTLKGKVEKEEDWGEKTLAYSIKNNNTAHFFNYAITIDKSQISELKKRLNFNEKILRYLLLIS